MDKSEDTVGPMSGLFIHPSGRQMRKIMEDLSIKHFHHELVRLD